MELDLSQDTSLLQTVKVSPRLVAANYILELSSLELQQAINEELNDNPALELVDIPTCPVCGTELQGSVCPRCLQRQKSDDVLPRSGEVTYEENLQPQQSAGDDDFDPLTQVASEQTLAEVLLSELGTLLDDEDIPIAEYLVGSLDDKGYLSCTVDEAAYELEVDVRRVRHVLSVLQGLEPIGVGARNLRECLLLQLDYLARNGIEQPHAREIIDEHLFDLGEHKFGKIAHELHISTDAVAAVWNFVKAKLNPHPGHGFSPTNDRDRDTRSMYILPDVIISRKEDDFEIDVVESRRFFLRINPMYAQLGNPSDGTAALNTDDRKHVQQYVSRAKLFIANINQRRQTLHNISRCLVGRQREFLAEGVRHLKPLSRAAIAEELGIHESTVSRATAGKYVMLPSGEVIPFSHFFTPSLSIKDVIKEFVERENRPLTDAEIADRLRESGINIARRTVAKYRMQLNILPSSLR
ncbi:MAG TPA: RNA polymerase factor sigma-54 [Chloroflexota bacterium]|nr:RNA polymerase factor sigma-54 [Chloroflexota bacterium]